MESENVATPHQATGGTDHDLWIGGGGESVLTVTLNKQSKGFPPHEEQCAYLNQMIQGLARAAKAVKYHADNDVRANMDFTAQPVEDIADAIVLLSQLSEAIRSEVSGVQS